MGFSRFFFSQIDVEKYWILSSTMALGFLLALIGTVIIMNLRCIYSISVYRNYNEKFRKLALTSDYVYIGSYSKIFQLNSSLRQLDLKHVSFGGVNPNSENSIWLLTTHNNESLIVCSYQSNAHGRTQCLKYKILPDFSVLTYEAYTSLRINTPMTKYIITTVNEQHILIIASSKCINEMTNIGCDAVSSYKLYDFDRFDPYHIHLGYAVTYKEETKHVIFKAILEIDNFIYFLYNTEEGLSKLGKKCKRGSRYSRSNLFEDTPIVCSHNNNIYTLAQDVVHWKGYLYIVFNDDSSNVICRYTIRNMAEKFMLSRQERLKCPYASTSNVYFRKQALIQDLCFNKTTMQCQLNGGRNVSESSLYIFI